jgi:phage-related protein
MVVKQATIEVVTKYMQKGAEKAEMSQKRFIKNFERLGLVVKNSRTAVDKYTGQQFKLAQVTGRVARESKKFRAEWLSVMFLGMAMSRIFGGIIKEQFDLWGITEMLSASWATVMQPAMALITPMLYDILDTMMDLPENTQMVIGLSVLGFEAIAGIMQTLATLHLGVMGLELIFPGLLASITKAGGLFKWLGLMGVGTFLAIAAIVAFVIYGIWSAFKTNFGNIKGYFDKFIEGLKQAWSGFKQFWKGVWKVIVGAMTGDFDKIKEGFSDIWNGAKDVVLGTLKWIWSAISIFAIGVLKGLLDGVDFVFNLIIKAINKLTGKKLKLFNTAANLEEMLTKKQQFAQGGIVPGKLGEAVPIIAHGGERITPSSKTNNTNSEVVVNNNYYVNVADKREFEAMLKNNNSKLVSDIRRQIET